jgi:AraC-like DNA-binding protein
MIHVTATFGRILEDWLSGLGLAPELDEPPVAASSGSLSLPEWTRRVQTAVARAPGPARGLDIGSKVKLSHTGPLGYLVVNSRTLAELLETYMLLEKWFYGRNWSSSRADETRFEIAWSQSGGVPDRLIEQLHAMAFLTVVREACPTAGNPAVVEVMNTESGERDAYEQAFGCPVRFDRPALRLVFPAAALRAPVEAHRSSVRDVSANCRRTLREAYPGATDLVRAVQESIMHHLPTGASIDSVAESMNMSRRTLQRRLGHAGCTYRQLLNGLRERHASCLLDDPQISLGEAAFLLGYSEQSAFNHAYRRWTGSSPRRNSR